MNKCVLRGADLPYNMTQLMFATYNKGIESACMRHENSEALKQYGQENGGFRPVIDAWNLRNKKESDKNDN